MADERLRELERRWQESGSERDALPWLKERIRQCLPLAWSQYELLSRLDPPTAAGYLNAGRLAGDLTERRIALAAYCGHLPAQSMSSAKGPSDLCLWGEGLEEWGVPALLRSLLAIGDWLLEGSDPGDRRAYLALRSACEAWLSAPSDSTLGDLLREESAFRLRGSPFASLSEYLTCADLGVKDTSGAVGFIVEGLLKARDMHGESVIRSVAERELVRFALSPVLSEASAGAGE